MPGDSGRATVLSYEGIASAMPGAGIRQPRRLVAAALMALVLGIRTGVIPTPGLEGQQTLISVTAPAHAGMHAIGHDD